MKLTKVKPGKGPATEVYRKRGEKPTRYAYKGIVIHKGKPMQERLGFKGIKKVVEVAFVPKKK